MSSKVTPDPTVMARFVEQAEDEVYEIAKRVARTARRLAPRDSGDLIDSIEARRTANGAEVTCSSPYWAHVEYGTGPHIIRSRGPWPLRDRHGNVFGRVVHHPGTPAQPFLRPALYREGL